MKFTTETLEAPDLASPIWRISVSAIKYWAYLGGVLLLAITAVEAYNAVVKLTTGVASASEHELVKYMVGISIFTFLPYCQLQNGHIAVDIFTQKAPPLARLIMAALGTVLGLLIAVLLLKQMYLGMQSYIDFREITPVLKLPIWTAFPFVLASLALWALACVMSIYNNWLEFRALQISEA